MKRLNNGNLTGNQPSLWSACSMSEAADYVGNILAEKQRSQAERDTANTNFEATFIFGG